MALTTTAQLQALKTYITTDPDGRGFAAHLLPAGDGDNGAILALLNATTPAYYVIRTDVPVADILGQILFAKYTPNTAITSGNAAQHNAVTNLVMTKQNNLLMLGITRQAGSPTFDATQANQVSALKDGTTNVPTQGASFTNQDVGWATILTKLQRQATYAEKLFAAASTVGALQNAASARGTQYDGTNGNPDVMTVQGALQLSDVQAALAS